MGVYSNPGNDGFRLSVNDDIYVDKTEKLKVYREIDGGKERSIL